jgi:hypothetical protein
MHRAYRSNAMRIFDELAHELRIFESASHSARDLRSAEKHAGF